MLAQNALFPNHFEDVPTHPIYQCSRSAGNSSDTSACPCEGKVDELSMLPEFDYAISKLETMVIINLHL